MTTVGIVGVGLLGDAVASRLRAAGHAVVGYDVVTAAMDRLAAVGGTPAKSAGDVARAAEVVCTILPSLATVEEAILGPHPQHTDAVCVVDLLQGPEHAIGADHGAADRGPIEFGHFFQPLYFSRATVASVTRVTPALASRPTW